MSTLEICDELDNGYDEQTDEHNVCDSTNGEVIGWRRMPGVKASQNTAIHPAMRCAIIGALAYLAQPMDMIPDDTRAGFGFVDDCMLLRATVGEYFDVLPVGFTSLHLERYHLLLMAICIPADRLNDFQSTMDGVWRMFQYLLNQSPAKSAKTIQTLMHNPMDFDLKQVTKDTEFKPGPNITHPPGAENFSIIDDQISVTFPTGGQLILRNQNMDENQF